MRPSRDTIRKSVKKRRNREKRGTRLPDSLDVRKTGVDVLPSVCRIDEDLEIGGDRLE